jgi:UDP-galactopyranose mutase
LNRRPHIGGNAYDCYNDAGILVHRYGPHIFHTNSERIWDYLSRFTAWRPYQHRVLAYVDGKMLPMPINLTTINRLYGLNLSSSDMAAFLAQRAEAPLTLRTARDVVMATVGKDLYEKFFEGYTRKQWGVDPSQLDKSVTARIPTRTNTDDRYFGDVYQAMPKCGYSRLFENLLDHRNIKLMLNTDYREITKGIRHERMIYSGPVDEFFDYRFGPLPYRSLQFRHVTLNRSRFQPVAVVNYPSANILYTRITEYKHLTGQANRQTSISLEFPADEGDPYYPVPQPGKRPPVQEIPGSGKRHAGRLVRWPAGHLPLLQHGSGGRSGAHALSAPVRTRRRGGTGWTGQKACHRLSCGEGSSVRSPASATAIPISWDPPGTRSGTPTSTCLPAWG